MICQWPHLCSVRAGPTSARPESVRDYAYCGVNVTKSERLMFLITMLKTRRVSSVLQMCASCEVSERTIYRDLGSLSRMNIPVYYDRGYRLAHKVAFPGVDLSIPDLELLCYCLRHHPLTGHAFFARRFRIIERKIRDRIHNQVGHNGSGICLLDSAECDQPTPPPEYKQVSRFLTSLFESVIISIQLAGASSPHQWYPVALRIRRCLPFFVVTESLDSAPIELDLSGIDRIRRTPQRIDLHSLEQYRRRWLNTSMPERKPARTD